MINIARLNKPKLRGSDLSCPSPIIKPLPFIPLSSVDRCIFWTHSPKNHQFSINSTPYTVMRSVLSFNSACAYRPQINFMWYTVLKFLSHMFPCNLVSRMKCSMNRGGLWQLSSKSHAFIDIPPCSLRNTAITWTIPGQRAMLQSLVWFSGPSQALPPC